jgi:chromatin remodeling complex protein RSC6
MPRKAAPTQTTSAKATTAPAATGAKKPRKARATSATKTATPTTPAAVEEKVVAPVATETAPIASGLHDEFAEFLGKLNQLASQFSSLRTDFRSLEKKWTRELKAAQKTVERRKRKVGNRAPSGFVKPTLISDELATFLGKTSGTEMARTEVTREINQYIRSNALQDKANGRKINPDAALASLLKLGSGDELTYFNLQRYMSPHFAKLGQAIPAANIQ